MDLSWIILELSLSGGHHIVEKIREHKRTAELEDSYEEYISIIEIMAGMGHYSSSSINLIKRFLHDLSDVEKLKRFGLNHKFAIKSRAHSLSILSHIAMNQGEPEKSINLTKLALPLWEQLGQKDRVIYLRNLKAINERINEKVDSAIETLEETERYVENINIYKERNHRVIHELIEFYRNKSKVLALKGNFDESKKINKKALDISHELASREGNEFAIILPTKDEGQILVWEGINNRKYSILHKGGNLINNSSDQLTKLRPDYNIADVVIKNALLEYLFFINDSRKEVLMTETERISSLFGYGHEIEKINKLKKQYGLISK